MERLVERCACLDVHKDSVVACVGVPGEDGERRQETRSFRTTTQGLLVLLDWLRSWGSRASGWNRPAFIGGPSITCQRTTSTAGC